RSARERRRVDADGREMSARCLAIVERAYRGTIEEQYGHIVAAAVAFCRVGCPTDLLLRGNAVLYARRDQPRMTLTLGDVTVDTLPHFESALAALAREGASVYAARDDCRRLAVDLDRLVAGVIHVDAAAIAALVADHRLTWYW